VQNASVAGISRVMSSFVQHAQASTHAKVEMLCTSLVPPNEQEAEPSWQKTIDPQNRITTLLYEGPLPVFTQVLEQAKGIRDLQHAFLPLIEAYVAKLQETQPDIVLINGTYHVPWCLMLAAKRLKLPIVVHYHGSITKETEHWENKKNKRIIHNMEAAFYRGDIRYVFPSRLIKSYVEKHIFNHALPPQRALVLPNPIPEEFFAAPMFKYRRGIGFVGRWTRIKNISFLKRFVDTNARHRRPRDMYVVTDQNSKSRAVKILGEKVHYIEPFTSPETMAAFYAKMKVIICPSYFETYGNVAQEAVAAGTAALVNRNMGVAEIFEEVGLSRLIVNFSNMNEVFETIQNEKKLRISKRERKALRNKGGALVVHEQLLQYMRYVQLHGSV
jgi:glycosyltransferase involved in cell wall biosynthesis